jgi:transcription initiation factor TFIIB
VVEERIIDPGPEHRLYSNDVNNISRVRTGGPELLTMFDKGISTEIDNQNKDYSGKKLNPRQSNRAYRVRKYNNRYKIQNGIELNLRKAMTELDLACSLLQVPKDVKTETAILYRRVLKDHNLRGRNIRNTVIATLYITCRNRDVPNNFKDFTKKLGIKRKDLNAYISLLRKTLDLKISSINAADFVARYCSELGFSFHIQKKVYELLEQIKKTAIWSGRNPTKFIAGVLYVVGILEGERRTQSQVSHATNVSEVTIRSRSRDIQKVLKMKIPI